MDLCPDRERGWLAVTAGEPVETVLDRNTTTRTNKWRKVDERAFDRFERARRTRPYPAQRRE